MSNLKLTLEYNGASFSGWQSQPGQRTIQGCLEDALQTYLGVRPDTTASGRTDKGVHAKAQVVSFEAPESFDENLPKLKNSLNGITPPEISIKNIQTVDSEFNARHSAHIKCYSYSLNVSGQSSPLEDQRSLSVSSELNFPKMISAAKLFAGEHDFSSFRSTDCMAKSTVRTILVSEFTRTSDYGFQYRVHGKGFLMHMIRIIMGTLIEVGRGRFDVEDIPRILKAKDRTQAGSTVAAKGLCLEWVKY